MAISKDPRKLSSVLAIWISIALLFTIVNNFASESVDYQMIKVFSRQKNELNAIYAALLDTPALSFVGPSSIHFEATRIERATLRRNPSSSATAMINSIITKMRTVGANRIWFENGVVRISYGSITSENCDYGLILFPDKVLAEEVVAIGHINDLYEGRRGAAKSWEIVRRIDGNWFAYASCSY